MCRMHQNLLTDLLCYHREYGISHNTLRYCKKNIPVLHPGPVNRGVEMSGEILDDKEICLVESQVENGIPIRIALLYLLAAKSKS